MKKRFFIIQQCKTRNLGDRILGKGFESLLKKYDLIPERIHYGILPVLTFKKIINVLKILKEQPSEIFIGGGQLLLPGFLKNAFFWTIISKITNSKLNFFSVGTEKINKDISAIHKLLLKLVLKHASAVRLRDKHSQKLIEKLTGKKYPVVPDTAYELENELQGNDEKQNIFVCPTKKKAALKYDMYSNMSEYYEDFYRKIKSKKRSEEDIKIFSTNCKDYRSMEKLYSYLIERYPEEEVSFLSIEDEDELFEKLSRARVVIGGRMHSVIISHMLGADCYTINQNEKIKCYSENTLPQDPKDIRKKLESSIEEVLYEELDLKE